MSSRKSFEEKITENLIKTGLPTEIKVHKLLHKRGWDVRSQYSFIDESGPIRSCDFRASFYGICVSEDSDQRYVCQLYIECKKSDNKPWVFYTGPESEYELEESLAALFEPTKYKRNDPDKELYAGLEKIKNIHDNVHSAIAYSYQIPFVNQNKENYQGVFYTAEMQVLKAIYNSEPIPRENINYLNIYPLIIFNGYMFKCDLAGDDLVVSRIDYVRYSSSGIPENKKDVLIDVVTMDYLESYIELVESEISLPTDS